MKIISVSRNKILFGLTLISLHTLIVVHAQKDDVEWLFPPGPTNDVFNQPFGPMDFFGPQPGLSGPQGPIGGGGGPGYKVSFVISGSSLADHEPNRYSQNRLHLRVPP